MINDLGFDLDFKDVDFSTVTQNAKRPRHESPTHDELPLPKKAIVESPIITRPKKKAEINHKKDIEKKLHPPSNQANQKNPFVDLTDEQALELIENVQDMAVLEMDDTLHQIESSRAYLNDRAMDAFFNIVNRNYPNYRSIHVYDPLGDRDSARTYDTILRQRYPDLQQILHCHPRITQPDLISCGVFAIAYATILILGGDPTQITLAMNRLGTRDNTMALSRHLVQIIQREDLTPFPS